MASKTYRILSLDGGGIRGLMTAVWLERLKRLLSKPLHSYFCFQVPLDEAHDDVDNGNRTYLNALTLIATSFIDSGCGKKQLENLAKRLQES